MKSLSPLVPHQPYTRRLWMFPRNIRRIWPWKIAQVLTLFYQHARDAGWSGKQDVQDAFGKSLKDAGLIKKGTPYDPHSGGPRTYEAQLKSLGLIFNRRDRTIWLTRAGEDIFNSEAPLPILRAQILRHQYPSVYGNLRGVNINPAVRVKPFLFILELLHDDRLGFLTNEEICVPVIYGHSAECKNLCIEKILKLRGGNSWEEVISDPQNDLYTPRCSGQSIKKRLRDIRDVANTFKNCLQACCLISVHEEEGQERISLNPDAEKDYQDALSNADRFIDHPEVEESFQRAYGCWDRNKDTRQLTEATEVPVKTEESIIAAAFYEYCGNRQVTDIPEDLIGRLQTNHGFNVEIARDVIEKLLPRALDYFEATFLELSAAGASRATAFERAIASVFQDAFHFRVRHTGQMRRPKGAKGGYADVFVAAADNKHCGILDGKATGSYSMPNSDFLAMTYNYIPNYRELSPQNELKLEFAMYVAAGFSGSINETLRKASEACGVPCSAIKARDVLLLARKKKGPDFQESLRKAFSSGKLIHADDVVGNAC